MPVSVSTHVLDSVSGRPAAGVAVRLFAGGDPGTAEPVAAALDSTRAPAVEAIGLSRRYGDGDHAVHALRGVSLQVPAGQYTAVMGPSGSGKSTLMHLLAGLDRPTDGQVRIGGADITEELEASLATQRQWLSQAGGASAPAAGGGERPAKKQKSTTAWVRSDG